MSQSSNQIPIRARGLAKQFGDVRAVAHIDLDVATGEALGLLGPNGAGKSTALSMLMGLSRPDAGEALIFGHAAGSQGARQQTGATPQATDFPDQLSPREILTYTAARYGTQPDIDSLAERFGLKNLMDRRTAGFSGGELRRVSLALAFVGKPKLVFLDEPTTGLDSAAQDGFREVARDYVTSGGTLVLTSHHWDEIEAICDTIALIDRGETVLSGRIGDIRAQTSINRLSFALPQGVVPAEWMAAEHDGRRWHIETAESDAVLRRLAKDAVPFKDLTLQPIELKDLIDRLRQKETIQ